MFTGMPILSNGSLSRLESYGSYATDWTLHTTLNGNTDDVLNQSGSMLAGDSVAAQAAILQANEQDAPQLSDRKANCYCVCETGSLVELRKQHEERRKKLGLSSPLDISQSMASGRYSPHRTSRASGRMDAMGTPLNRLLTVLPDETPQPPPAEDRPPIFPVAKTAFRIRFKMPQSA